MISTEELKKLIEVEKIVRPGKPHDIHLRYDFYEPTDEIEELYIEEYNINYASKFLLESYCWRTFEYVNDHLRSSCGVPTDKFVKDYLSTFSKLLDGIQSYNNQIAWRWVNCEDGFEYLKTQIGKTIQIPEFKSTSVRKLPKRTYWQIKTNSNSNGKMIYKHIEKNKGNVEQEILFKANSIFRVVDSNSNCIFLEEIKETEVDLILCENYWENEYES